MPIKKGMAAAGVVGLLIAGCSASNDPARGREHCLYSAVHAYPTWPEGNGPVLEVLAECKNLPAKDKAELRQTMTAFVNRAQERSK